MTAARVRAGRVLLSQETWRALLGELDELRRQAAEAERGRIEAELRAVARNELSPEAWALLRWLRFLPSDREKPTLGIVLSRGPTCLRSRESRDAAVAELIERGMLRTEISAHATRLVLVEHGDTEPQDRAASGDEAALRAEIADLAQAKDKAEKLVAQLRRDFDQVLAGRDKRIAELIEMAQATPKPTQIMRDPMPAPEPTNVWQERLRQARTDYATLERTHNAAQREIADLKRTVTATVAEPQRLVNELGARLNATRADLDAALRSEATVRGQLERANARIRELTLTPKQRVTAAGIARRLDS